MWLNQRVDSTWSSINNFARIIEANFLCRDECVATQSVTDFGHRFEKLITSFNSNAQLCVEFLSMVKCMRQYLFQRGFQPHCARKAQRKLQMMPWRHNEIQQRWITRSQVDLFSSCHCLKLASSLLGCTARTSGDSWINEMSSNLLRYQCETWCAVGNRCNPM